MASTPVQSLALTGTAMLRAVAKYKQSPLNALISCGFFGPKNYHISNPEIFDKGQSAAEFYSSARQQPAGAFERSLAKRNSYTYPHIGSTSLTVAYVQSKTISSAAGFNTSTQDETTAQLEVIPFDLFTGSDGYFMSDGLIKRLSSTVNAHITAIEEKIAAFFLRSIRDPHNIKADGDGENPYGATKTFNQDIGITGEYAKQIIDLSSTNTDSLQLKAIGLEKETDDLVRDISDSDSQVVFFVMPQTAWTSYRQTFSSLTMPGQNYRGSMNMMGGEYGNGLGMRSFDNGGKRFIGMPDKYFDVEKIPATTGEDCWIAYALPSSAVHMFLSPANLSELVQWGDGSLFGDMDVLNWAQQIEGWQPNTYNMLATKERSDVFLEHYINMYHGGQFTQQFNASNYIRSYFRPLPPGSSANAMDMTFSAHCKAAIIRTQPHFIKPWGIPKTLV